MGASKLFRELAIVLIVLLFSLGAFLLHDATGPGTRESWSLVPGAVLCSAGLVVLYFLFKPLER